jgi:hypothetical protein
MTRRRPKLLPYPKDLRAKDRSSAESRIHQITMSDDGTAHGTDCIGELVTLYIQIPNERMGGWRSRCHHPDCKEMIENNEVQSTVYIKRVDKWNLWKTNHFHLICFIKYPTS